MSDNKDMKPLVAIRCITYNHEPYIRDALEGFVMQKTNFPFVAIVHDDASTDGTAAIIREYAEKYPDIIKPIYETENQYSKRDGSLGRIMNRAGEATGAKYIALCEGDDYWTDPLKLQKQVDFLESHPDYSISLHRVMTVDRDRHKQNWTIPPIEDFQDGIVTLRNLVDEEFYRGKWAFHTSSFIYRCEMGEKYASLRYTLFKSFPYGDMPLLLTCLASGNGYFISDIMSCYTVMSGGYNSTLAANPLLAVKDYLGVANALSDFNKYTKYKYNRGLKRAIYRYKYRVIVLQSGFSFKMLSPIYHHFYYDALFRFAKYRTPRLLSLYRRVKSKLLGTVC